MVLLRTAGLFTVALVTLAGCAAPTDASPTPLPSSNQAPTLAPRLAGVWRPVTLQGRPVARAQYQGTRVTLTFTRRGAGLRWVGYDGCNWTGGPARLTRSRAFVARARSTTLVGCLQPVPMKENIDVVTAARRAQLSARRLVLFDALGRRIGTYARVA